jgi:hypothetical protein
MAFGGQTTAELGNTRSALAVWAEARSEMRQRAMGEFLVSVLEGTPKMK